MFVDNFLSEVPVAFYIVFSFFILTFSALYGIKNILGPTLLSSVFFFMPASLALILADPIDKFFVFLGCVFFCLFYLLGNRISIVNKTLEIKYINQSSSHNLFGMTMLLFYIIIITYIYSVFSTDSKVDKLTWTLESGGVHYLFECLSMVILVISFDFLERRKIYLSSIFFIVLILAGILMGGKGILVNLFSVYLVVKSRKSFNSFSLIGVFFILTVVILLTQMVFFGGINSSGFAALTSRVLATIDGTYIIFYNNVYGNLYLTSPVLYYLSDFMASKIYGVSDGLGVLLARFSDISYPPHGGPNDSIVNYILLYNDYNKLVALLFISTMSFIAGTLDRIIKNKNFINVSISLKIAIYPLYLLLPLSFQASGTFFMILARVYIILIPILLLYYFIKALSHAGK
ncbi:MULTISPECIES: hypothetical protein [Yersinia pseudotuberculosis complex]|nr:MULTISPECIES: hypothetical protein [Yersinia pseudotuberculosis complex]CRG49456.1 Uncharacterised protein [Yersinia wautersii]CRY69918.1 Uncharacterised protein [Yersinia pseudotuberculosis]